MLSGYFFVQKASLDTIIIAITCAITCSSALAGGFQVSEHSSAGLGRSYAGEGVIADTAASASRNPATIMMFDRLAVSGGGVFVDPNIRICGQAASGENLDISNVAPTLWIPNLHFVMPVNQRTGFAASLISNYGLGSQYNASWLAGEVAGTTSLASINANVSGAYQLSPQWSLGLGVNVVYAQAKIDRYSGLHMRKNTPLHLPVGTSIAHIKGDGWGYGVNAGILYQFNHDNRYALTWRSKINVQFHGNYSSDLPDNALINHPGSALPWGSGGQTIAGKLAMNFPEIWELSGYNKLTSQWAIHYSLMYTRWRQFRELSASGDAGQTLFYRYEGFHDAWRVAFGTTLDINHDWTVRTGIAFDQSPIPAENRSVAIPDQNRLWLSLGVSYAFTQNASLDLGLAWMYGQSLRIDDEPYTNLQSHATAWLYGVNVNYRF